MARLPRTAPLYALACVLVCACASGTPKVKTSFPIGVAVNAGAEPKSLLSSPAEQNRVSEYFTQITPGNIMKMRYLHPELNSYNFADADALLDWAARQNLSLHAHTMIWHADYQLPQWLKDFQGDKTAWLALLKDHEQTLARHFEGKVKSWDVVNEALEDGGGYRNSIFWQKTGTDYIEQAFINAHYADQTAELYYNDYNLEHDAEKLATLTAMLDDFIARKIPITGVGFQMHVFMDFPSIATLKQSWQKIVDRGLKVKLSELDIAVNNPNSSDYKAGKLLTQLTPQAASAQKLRYCEIVTAYLQTVPPELRGGITVWGLEDSDSWLNGLHFKGQTIAFPLLFNEKLQPKPALQGFQDGLALRSCQAR